jgi:hypothetical protein
MFLQLPYMGIVLSNGGASAQALAKMGQDAALAGVTRNHVTERLPEQPGQAHYDAGRSGPVEG